MKKILIVFLEALCLLIMTGCNEQQINKIALTVQDVNNVATAIADKIQSIPESNDFFANIQNAANTTAGVTVAISPLYPAAVPVAGIATLIAVIAGLFAKKKTAEAAQAEAKYQAHKQGVELTMKEVSASTVPEVKAVETQLYKNIGDARTNLGVQ